MKRNLVFVLFALVSVVGFSQVSWNAKVGMNISNFTGDFDMNAKVGFKIGGGMEYGFNEIWSLQPSLFVSSKGAKKDELSVNAVVANFNVADNTNIVLSAGPYFACGIAGNSKVDLGKGRLEVDTFGDDGLLKRGDVGLGIGVAAEFGKIIAGLDGQFGFVDVMDNVNGKNLNLSISVGYKF